MSQLLFSAADALHDVFTLLCDAALARPARFWRYRHPHPYRLRFLREVIHWAGLVDSATQRPTPLTADWLHQPPAEQIGLLAEAWAAHRDTSMRQACLTRWMALAPSEPTTPAAFTQRTAPQRQRALWLPLVWLGLLHADLDEQHPQTLSRAILPESATPGGWEISAGVIRVTPPYAWPDLWELEAIAELRDPGPPRGYALTRSHWRTALTQAYTSASALALLERASGEPVPLAVWEFFSPAHPHVIAQPGVLFTFVQAAPLDQLCQRPTWRARFGQRLSPRHVWVSAPQAPVIVRALQRHGLTVKSPPFPRGRASPTATDRMQLLLAACVMQALSQSLGLPAPLDANTLAALTHGLPLALQRRLERSTRRQLEHLYRHLPEPHALVLPQPVGDVRTAIVTALEQGRALQLHYQPPPPRALITRAVIPLRLEPWGAHTYLLAYCLTREDTRTFRLDRITQATLLDVPATPP